MRLLKDQRGIGLVVEIIVIAIISVVLVGGGYFFYTERAKRNDQRHSGQQTNGLTVGPFSS